MASCGPLRRVRDGAARRAGGFGYAAMLASLAAIALLILGLRQLDAPAGDDAREIVVYCAAGSKPPVAAAARAFEEECGIAVRLQYGGSGTLLSQLRARPVGVDLYIAADTSYIERARSLGLVQESLVVARQRPVVLVAEGNPLRIESLEDLLREGVRFGLAHPQAAAIGQVTQELASRAGLWSRLEKACKVFKPTVSDLANDVALGAVDAAVVWDAAAALHPSLEAVRSDRLDAGVQSVQVGVVRGSERSASALRFARFLAAPERGNPRFAEAGFEAVAGDRWAERPELLFYAGSMFQSAIEETVSGFERREGVDVTRVYNGCGILVSQMEAGAQPDAYFSCDESFLEVVGERFAAPVDVSENRLVLLVARGNPQEVRGLGDLTRPGLRVGLAHPEKSALGQLTRALLLEAGVLAGLEASGNWKQDAPQGDFLVNAMRAGALDAVVCYASNAALAEEHLDRVELHGDRAIARQPFAVATGTGHPALAARLLDALTTTRSRESFETLGFHWIHDGGADASE